MKKIILTFILLFCFFSSVWAYNKTELDLIYNKYYLNISKKQTSNSDLIKTLENLDSKLIYSIYKTTSESKKDILITLKKLNRDKISSLKIENIKKNAEINLFNNAPFVSELTLAWYKSILLNSSREFTNNGEVFKLIFDKYYLVNSWNYTYFLKNKLENAYIVRYDWSFIIVENSKIEKKYTYDELYNLFTNNYSLDDWLYSDWENYYFFKIKEQWFFKDIYWLTLYDLEWNWYSKNKTLIIKDWSWKYFFTNNFEKIKLFPVSFLNNISNKKEFLKNLYYDLQYSNVDFDVILQQIRDISLEITKNKISDEEKTIEIYKWIIDNIDYYKDFKNGEKQVFSWILTFKNKTWVCDWYTKLFLYMLSFAWVKDVEVKRWFVFDNADFPEYWHAWVRIWDYYYDPTFDDPVWNNWMMISDYMYFKIPKDLLYINRYDWIDISPKYKDIDLESRKKISLKNMYTIYEKFKNYKILNKIKVRKYLGLNEDDDLNMDYIINNIPFYNVANFSFKDDLWMINRISSLKYYPINNKNLELVLFGLDIDLSKVMFFKWYDNNWNYEYRLWYDLNYY